MPEITFALVATTAITISIFTYLYRENFAFRLSEHILIGSFTGNILVMGLRSIKESGIDKFTSGQTLYIVPLVLGLLFFSTFVKKYAWLARYPLAVGIATSAAVEARTRYEAYLHNRVLQTITTPLVTVNAIIILLTCLSVVAYFIYSVEQKGIMKPISKIGRTVLMATFGLTIAFDVSSRAGDLTARFYWLWDSVPTITIVIGAIAVAWIIYDNKILKTQEN